MSNPAHKLYDSTGTILKYTFENVVDYPNGDNQDPAKFIETENTRGNGALIIEGGNQSFDFSLEFILTGTDYYNLMSKISTLKSTITKFTLFVLKIQKTQSPTTYDNYTVKRVLPIEFPVTGTKTKRTKFQRVVITFKVLSTS